MPHRIDKRDIVALAAYLAGLEIEFVDGVNGSDVSLSERPDKYLTMLSSRYQANPNYRDGKRHSIQTAT
jgi:hypothetical protein